VVMLRGIAGAVAQATPASWLNNRCLINETVQICSTALEPLSRSFSSQPAKRRRIAENGPGLEAFLTQVSSAVECAAISHGLCAP
jgi:hypothetical protein